MTPRSIASTRPFALILLGVLLAAGVYRTATRSVTAPEALLFERWIRPPVRDLLSEPFDPRNHVLYTLLAKRSVALFRLSEFSLRLPALLAGGLYLWAAFRLVHRLFGNGRLLLRAIAVLSLNPLLPDLFSQARGYGLALALWMAALDFLVAYLQCSQPLPLYNLNLAGICLGLSAAADLALLWPSAALVVVLLAVCVARSPASVILVTERLILTAIATGFIFLILPLSHARFGSFTDPADPHWTWLWPASALAVFAIAARTGRKPLAAVVSVAALIASAVFLFRVTLGPPDSGFRDLVLLLRRQSGARAVTISATSELLPILGFYQARYRQANWRIVAAPAPGVDFQVLPTPAVPPADPAFRVLFIDRGVLLIGRRL